MATCEVSPIITAAACILCLPEKQLAGIEAYLLCLEAGGANTNLIPGGTTYNGFNNYSLTGLTVGALYRLLRGPNEVGSAMSNGPQILHPVAGVPLFFRAAISTLNMTGASGDLVTASVTLIS